MRKFYKYILSLVSLLPSFINAGCGASNEYTIYDEITDAFYKQKFVDKGIEDDSHFCGYYQPRKIEKNSFLMMAHYGELDGYHVSRFMINGFENEGFYSAKGSVEEEVIDDRNDFCAYGQNLDFDDLYPIFYKNKTVYYMDELIENRLMSYLDIATFFFKTVPSESKTIYVPTLNADKESTFPLTIYKDYFDNLPNVVGENKKTKSLLIPKYETIKESFIKKYIVNKGYTEDAPELIKDIGVENNPCITTRNITERSVTFYKHYEYKNTTLIFYDVNDHALHWNTSFEFVVGPQTFTENRYIIPLIYIDNDVYLLTEAYDTNILPTGFWDYIEQVYNPIDQINVIENKRLERNIYLPEQRPLN